MHRTSRITRSRRPGQTGSDRTGSDRTSDGGIGKGRTRRFRYRAHLAALAACGALTLGALGALAVPVAASAAAKWQVHVFSITYDGTGKYDYNAQGANGDSGCYMDVSQNATYSFDQLWTVRVGFKSAGKGKFDTKIMSINHQDGPQAFGDVAKSHLEGKQTALPDNECQDITIVDNTGKFDCTSKKVTLTAVPNPQMKMSRVSDDIEMAGRAFIDGIWSYTGKDSIPGDKKGCQTYEDGMTYGSDLIPGIIATTKVSLGVKQLNNLKKKQSISVPIAFGKNTEFPRQSECAATFGKPNVCVIHSQSLTATFKVTRVGLPPKRK